MNKIFKGMIAASLLLSAGNALLLEQGHAKTVKKPALGAYNKKFSDARYNSKTNATNQGYEVGQKTWSGAQVVKVNDKAASTMDDLKKLSANVRYANGMNSAYSSTIVQSSTGGNSMIYLKPNYTTQQRFNTGKLFKADVYNKEILKLINKERKQKGVKPMQLNTKLKAGNDVRAQEMADYGTFALNGKIHTRPDKSSYTTAFSKAVKPTSEITHTAIFDGNYYALVSEKALAERSFKGWKKSAQHYGLMMSPANRSGYFTVRIGENSSDYGKPNTYAHLISNGVFTK